LSNSIIVLIPNQLQAQGLPCIVNIAVFLLHDPHCTLQIIAVKSMSTHLKQAVKATDHTTKKNNSAVIDATRSRGCRAEMLSKANNIEKCITLTSHIHTPEIVANADTQPADLGVHDCHALPWA
jgi:hypothetical protein